MPRNAGITGHDVARTLQDIYVYPIADKLVPIGHATIGEVMAEYNRLKIRDGKYLFERRASVEGTGGKAVFHITATLTVKNPKPGDLERIVPLLGLEHNGYELREDYTGVQLEALQQI